MTDFEFSYGTSKLTLPIPPHNVLGVIDRPTAITHDVLQDTVDDTVKAALHQPIGCARLSKLLKQKRPGYVVIVVSDISRNIACYAEILDRLAGEIVEAGIDEKDIEFIVALGTHRRHTPDEHRLLYGSLVDRFTFSFHDCHGGVRLAGLTSTGLEVSINERVAQADFVVTTGRIWYHYLAGFSGGRKSVLPGVAGYETIRANHAKLLRPGVETGALEGNIINFEMVEAAHMVGVDFSLNVIEDSNRQPIWIKAGQLEAVFGEGCRQYRSRFSFPIREKADCIFVAAGHNDQDLFDSHKILNFATGFVKPGGSIVLLAEAGKGVGNEQFAEYLGTHRLDELLEYPEKGIEVGGHRAFVTARILKNHKVYVVSSINQDTLRRLSFHPLAGPRSVLAELIKNHGRTFKAYVNPKGLKLYAELAMSNN